MQNMAQPFSFSFSGDDIEADANDAQNDHEPGISAVPGHASISGPPPVEAQTHGIEELVGKKHDWYVHSCVSFAVS